jgi:DNA-binding CsgD family transcriptional regulator
MPKSERIKTSYPGVFYSSVFSKKNDRLDRSYYIRYRKNGEQIEEKVGQQLQNEMTSKRASMIRNEIVEDNRISFQDINREKKAGQELKPITKKQHAYSDNKKLFLETLLLFFESATDCIALFDSSLNLIEINPAGVNMLPRCNSKEEIIGKHLLEWSPESKVSGIHERCLKVIKTGEPFSIDAMPPPPNYGWKKGVYHNVRAFRVGRGLGMIVADITGRKLLEKKLREREQELEVININLEEANAAFKFLLKKRNVDQKELEDNIIFNIKELVEPYLERLKTRGLNEEDKNRYLYILEANLKDIVAPFSQTLSSKKFNLTPMEIKVANLVKHGKTTKEIADVLNVSDKTVCFHRHNIREKMGIKNMSVNLRSCILDLA